VLFIPGLARFELSSELDNASPQLSYLVVRCRRGLLNAMLLLEPSLFQFFAKTEDRFLEKFDFEIECHINREKNSHEKAQNALCFFVAKIYLIPASS
jgi:hypothetical protein